MKIQHLIIFNFKDWQRTLFSEICSLDNLLKRPLKSFLDSEKQPKISKEAENELCTENGGKIRLKRGSECKI